MLKKAMSLVVAAMLIMPMPALAASHYTTDITSSSSDKYLDARIGITITPETITIDEPKDEKPAVPAPKEETAYVSSIIDHTFIGAYEITISNISTIKDGETVTLKYDGEIEPKELTVKNGKLTGFIVAKLDQKLTVIGPDSAFTIDQLKEGATAQAQQDQTEDSVKPGKDETITQTIAVGFPEGSLVFLDYAKPGQTVEFTPKTAFVNNGKITVNVNTPGGVLTVLGDDSEEKHTIADQESPPKEENNKGPITKTFTVKAPEGGLVFLDYTRDERPIGFTPKTVFVTDGKITVTFDEPGGILTVLGDDGEQQFKVEDPAIQATHAQLVKESARDAETTPKAAVMATVKTTKDPIIKTDSFNLSFTSDFRADNVSVDVPHSHRDFIKEASVKYVDRSNYEVTIKYDASQDLGRFNLLVKGLRSTSSNYVGDVYAYIAPKQHPSVFDSKSLFLKKFRDEKEDDKTTTIKREDQQSQDTGKKDDPVEDGYGYDSSIGVITSKISKFKIGINEYWVNSTSKKIDVAPYVKDGRTYLPLRYVGDSVNIPEHQVHWDGDYRAASLWKEKQIVQVRPGEKVVWVNQQAVSADVAAEVAGDGRIMLPIRHVVEAFGGSIVWDEASQEITITIN